MGGVGKTSHFLALNINISKTVGDTPTVTILMTDRKSHMRFRLTKIDELDLIYKLEFSRNFAGFRRLGSQQRLNE